jgi:Predicted nucleotide-binding protein containing TIR-like domain
LDRRFTIALSTPLSENLSRVQKRFLEALTDKIVRRGLTVAPDSAPIDTMEMRFSQMRRFDGVLVFACCQWEAERLYRDQRKTAITPTEFCHIESTMAVAARKPLLVLREKALAERGVLRSGHLPNVVKLPNGLNPEWLEESDFQSAFNRWVDEVQCFRHVFLGYSSKATDTANKLYKFLTTALRLRVFDWHEFRPGDTIWDSIERAERSTACGLFLFMADDRFSTDVGDRFAPRDNVVYEAGYFAGAKGRKASLVIREEEAKIPTDLGGLLYLTLRDRNDISPLENQLREYLDRMLGHRS